MTQMGFGKDEEYDAIILISGEEEEDQSLWKGLTQTMKTVFVTQLDEVQGKLTKKFEEAITVTT